MQVVYSLAETQVDRDSVVTIGAYDGVHRGHRAVLDSVRRAAAEHRRASAVVTFFPHPSVALGRAEPFYLTSPEEKIEVLCSLGIDLLVVMRFTMEMSQTRAADYVAMLIERLRMREVHAGYDFAFGYQREGTIEFLQRSGARHGFDVQVIDALRNGGQPISSTGIRQALRQGDVETAAEWLGRPFRLSGTLARLDMMRLHVDVWQQHAIPADGIYDCDIHLDGERRLARATVGTETFASAGPYRTVFVDFSGDVNRPIGTPVALDFIKSVT